MEVIITSETELDELESDLEIDSEEKPDYERINLRSNHKQDLECLGCFLVISVIVMFMIKMNDPAFSLWWLLVPIALFVLGYVHAEKYQKSTNKVVTHYRAVKIEHQFPPGIRKCYDLSGKEESSIPDEDLVLYEYVLFVEHETVTESTAFLEKAVEKLESAKIIRRECKYLTESELREAIKKYGGDLAQDMTIEIVKHNVVQYFKTRNRNRWDPTDYQECAYIFPTDMDTSLGLAEAPSASGEERSILHAEDRVIPAAGWKFSSNRAASMRVVYLGILLGDFPVFLVTGCAYLDKRMMEKPTADKLANGLTRVMEKLYDRADVRSDQLRKLLDKKREGEKAEEGREKREAVERARKKAKLIQKSLDSSNFDDHPLPTKSGSGKWGWICAGIVIAIMLIIFVARGT